MAEQCLEGLVEADDDCPEGVEVDVGQDLDPEVLEQRRRRHGVGQHRREGDRWGRREEDGRKAELANEGPNARGSYRQVHL